MKIVGISACTAGIAHTYMAQEALEQECKKRGIDCKIETQGGMGIDNIGVARQLGFGGVVVCGDLWNRFNIHNQADFKDLISHFGRLRRAVY